MENRNKNAILALAPIETLGILLGLFAFDGSLRWVALGIGAAAGVLALILVIQGRQ